MFSLVPRRMIAGVHMMYFAICGYLKGCSDYHHLDPRNEHTIQELVKDHSAVKM